MRTESYSEMRDIVFISRFDVKGWRFVYGDKCLDVTYAEEALWVAPNKTVQPLHWTVCYWTHSCSFRRNFDVGD